VYPGHFITLLTRSAREQSVEKNIWAKEKGNNRKTEKINLQIEDLHNLHSSLSIIRTTISWRMRWAGNVVPIG
jgi:hypothetical protein